MNGLGLGSVGLMAAMTAIGAGGAVAQEGSTASGVPGGSGIGTTAPPGTISTGRPSFSAGAGTVPRGFFQLEGGYLYDRDDGDTTQTAPFLVLRYGAAEDLELRFGWSGFVVSETDGEEETDASDIVLGLKRTIYEPDDGPLDLGVLAQVSLPAGDGDASSDSVDPTVGLLWSYDVPGPTSAFGNLIVSSLTNDVDDRQTQLGASAGVSFPVASRLDGFVEYFGVFADEGAPSNNLDGGLLYLVNDNLQVDLFARVGLNEAAGDYGLGAGFGVRF